MKNDPPINLTADLSRALGRHKRVHANRVNRISALDDPCLRKLYYMRSAWETASPVDDGLQGLFETGNVMEPVIERIVSEVGTAGKPPWRIVGAQTATRDNLLERYEIAGTIDGFLQVFMANEWHTLGVVDIKTMSPNIYRVVQDYDGLARYPWTRRYRGQVMLYSLAHNMEKCYLLLVNKSNLYEMRLIEFDLDYGHCERLLTKADTINKALKADEVPQGVNDADHCNRCQFLSFCGPDLTTGGNLEIVLNEELEALLDKRAEVTPAYKEYGSLTRTIESMLKKGQDLLIGSWLIRWKEITVKGKAQWRKTITRLKVGKETDDGKDGQHSGSA